MDSHDDDYQSEIDNLRESHKRLKEKIRSAYTCQVCGQTKMHSRLHGYTCHNPEHNNVADVSSLSEWLKGDK